MIPNETFEVGQQVKIFDCFEDSYWPPDDYDNWDKDDEEIFGILGKILTIKEIRVSKCSEGATFMTEEGYVIYSRDIEYIIGGFGDIPDFNPPDVSDLSGLLFA